MSEPAAATKVTPRHYQIMAGLALIAVVLLHIQRGTADATEISLLTRAAMLLVGAAGIALRVRFLTPVTVLVLLAGTCIYEQHRTNQRFQADFHAYRFLDLTDVLLCMAVLTYVISHYRLYALRFGALPGKERPRSEESLSGLELVALIVPVPLSVLAAEVAGLLLRQHWELVGLAPLWKQLLALAWTVLLVMFLAAHLFRSWRRAQMTRPLALLMLQDILWNETRGEQRRIERWIAWRKAKGH